MEKNQMLYSRLFWIFVVLDLSGVCSKVYKVGPVHPYKAIGDVMSVALSPGDQIWIYARSTPYREKFVINNKGNASAPIVVKGVPDSVTGALPILDGSDAVTSRALDYWNEKRSLVKIGGASWPSEGAAHIRIELLHLRNAKNEFSFTDDRGQVDRYADNAACIHIETGRNIVLSRNILTGCGNGLFVSPNVRDVIVERNYIYANGNLGSMYEHNVYNEAIGITYRYNRFGPLLTGALGNNVKDRSAGIVFSFNLVVGGNRQLDLVESDSTLVRNDRRYRYTYVFGNILVENEGVDNRQILHYGGDGANTAKYRRGTLFLYHNTIISTRVARTTLIRLSTSLESCDARNNIVYVTATTDAGNQLELLSELRGSLTLWNNYFKPGFVDSFDPQGTGSVTNINPLTGTNVPFADSNFSTTGNVKLAKPLQPSIALPNEWPKVTKQYKRHQSYENRNSTDIGAYGFP